MYVCAIDGSSVSLSKSFLRGSKLERISTGKPPRHCRTRLVCSAREGLVLLPCLSHGEASVWQVKHMLCLRRNAGSKQPRRKSDNARNNWHHFSACRQEHGCSCLPVQCPLLPFPRARSSLPPPSSPFPDGFLFSSPLTSHLPKVSTIPG